MKSVWLFKKMPPGKYFFARSHMNGLCLDAEGGASEPGTHLVTWEQKAGNVGNENQMWYEDPSTGTIRSLLSDFCIDMAGTTLVLNPYEPGNTNQQWQVDGNVISSKVHSTTVIDIADCNPEPGARLCAWEQTGASNQKWDINYRVAKPFGIKSTMHGKVLDVRGEDRKPGAHVILYKAWSEPRDNQLWYEDSKGIIRSMLNEFALDSSKGLGESVTLQPYDPDNPNQQWVFGQDGRIHRIGNPNEALDIKGASSSNNAKVIMYNYHGAPNQKWLVEYI